TIATVASASGGGTVHAGSSKTGTGSVAACARIIWSPVSCSLIASPLLDSSGVYETSLRNWKSRRHTEAGVAGGARPRGATAGRDAVARAVARVAEVRAAADDRVVVPTVRTRAPGIERPGAPLPDVAHRLMDPVPVRRVPAHRRGTRPSVGTG